MYKRDQNSDNRYNDNEDVEVLDSFCFLGSTINSNEQSVKNYGTDKHLVEQPWKRYSDAMMYLYLKKSE